MKQYIPPHIRNSWKDLVLPSSPSSETLPNAGICYSPVNILLTILAKREKLNDVQNCRNFVLKGCIRDRNLQMREGGYCLEMISWMIQAAFLLFFKAHSISRGANKDVLREG